MGITAFSTMNKLLQAQLRKYFDEAGQLPENSSELLNAISKSYDHYEEEQKITERAIELRSKEMIELNSQLKNKKEDLKVAHQDLKTLFEDIDEVIYSVDMVSYKLTRMSAGCEKVYGYTAAEFLTDSDLWHKVIYPEDKHIAKQDVQLLCGCNKVFNQYRIIHKDESIRWIENKITPTFDKTGRLIQIDGIASDISERKRIKKQLEESVSILEATIESTADGILLTDFNGKITRFNKKFVELSRIPQEILDMQDDEKAIGFILDQLLNPEEFLSKVKELYVKQHEISFDILKFKDGRTFERYSQPQLINGNCVGRAWSFRDITDRKKAEDKIKESELRYRNLIEQASDAICIADGAMKFMDVNSYACGFLGYTKEEALQLSVTDVLFIEDLAANPFKFDDVQPDEIIRNERRFKRKDGASVTMEVSTRLTEDGRFIMFGHDVSQRKKSEEALKESEKRLRQIIDLVPHFIFAKDAKGKFILANEAVATAYGTTVENLIGKNDADFNTEKEEVEHFINEDLEIINSGTAKYNIEETITDATGNTRVLSTTKIPYTSTGLDTAGVLGVSVDVSENKKAEAVLKENEGQLTVASQIAKLGYWEFDVIKNLFKFNDQFYSIFKTTAEEVGGYIMSPERYAGLFVHPDDVPMLMKLTAEAIKSPDPNYTRQIEHRIKYSNGETGHMAFRFFIVKNEAGRTIKTFGAMQDITERKKGEETLRTSEINLEIKNRQLKEKNIELEQFAYIASHDLQEPLRTISGFVELLRKQYEGKFDQRADKYLTYIFEASDRMRVLIKDLLDYSRIGNEKELEQVDCDKILHNVLADLGIAINESGADIQYELLPTINGYATEIKQLFQNLITNAIKFRKKGTTPDINISVQKDQENWEFAFKDNGIGIEEKYNEKIFLIFQRLHNNKEYSGSGIGLSYCKKIVDLHKGKIWLKSEPGKGSTFYFTIPLDNPVHIKTKIP